MENNDRERRQKEKEIKDKIEIEEKILKEINIQNKRILKDYNMDKNELMETLSKTENKHKISQEKYFYAKNYYDNKDREYIKKFSYYQDLINPNLLIPIQKPITLGEKKRIFTSHSMGNIEYNDRDNENFRKVEEYKHNEKGVKMNLRNSTKKLPMKKLINKYNSTNVLSTSATVSTGNINFNTDEKFVNSTFNRTFKFNKTKNK